ncbi:MAG: N-acetylmuramic acid 6-phosphate etherase [Pelagimonas sp.]|uniref:N-acetylmuramic acid 6-phosphate etherase n=1 Tax=Pelagimonas sp. TaxID=2073170 RepID=UPI003D6AC0BD
MTLKTEQLHPLASTLDVATLGGAAAALVDNQVDAGRCVSACLNVIQAGADKMARCVRNGGTLYYVAAGSSGLMVAADAMELGGTFGIPSQQVEILMAGGIPTSAHMPGDVEDDVESLEHLLVNMTSRDCLIAVTASGSTPFTLRAAELAHAAGATVIGIANNTQAALFKLTDHAIALDTPPEVLSGSTRMGAGTAQKIALNTLSTLMGVALGHVYQGLMVNLQADNIKLLGRARGIVQQVTQVDEASAASALTRSGGDVKIACLLALGAQSPELARAALIRSQGHLGPAISRLHSHETTL